MQSHDKMLHVLDLFTATQPVWSFEDMQAHLGHTRSTLYRYLKTLSDAGLVAHLPRRGYSLGPRIIEMDRQILLTDPLISGARPVMRELAARQEGVVLLCRRYDHRVLCVHQEASAGRVTSTYDRGKAQSLLQGAASLVILAHLSTYQINRLYAARGDEIAAVGLAENQTAFRDTLKRIRQAGWAVTQGQVTAGVTGIAAPIFDPEGDVIGSLSVTLPYQDIPQQRMTDIAARVSFAAGVVTRALT